MRFAVENIQTFFPAFWSHSAIILLTVVFPFVPVTQITIISFVGLPEREKAVIHLRKCQLDRIGLLTGIIFRRNWIIWIMKMNTVEFYKKVITIQLQIIYISPSMSLKIETGNTNQILRTVSEKIQPAEIKSYKKIIQEMLDYIKDPENGWVGLAAPQIWVNKRIIVVSLMQTYEDENFRTIPMINPEIFEHSADQCLDEEGCLSVPWEHGDVLRWNWIKVRFYDEKWQEKSLLLKNLAARIVQHEIDHLDGILFIDKIQ